jgi:hypothetical protein
MEAKKIWFDDSNIYVETNENKTGTMPLVWFPRLYTATEADRNAFEL